MMTSQLNGRPAAQALLLSRYRGARRRLNAGLDRLDYALDLRERLWWQIDLDDARAEVAAFKRVCQSWRDRRAG